MLLKRSHEPAEAAAPAPKRSQRAPKPSQRKLESQLQLTPPPTQLSIEVPSEREPPIEVPESTPTRSIEPPTQLEERARRPSPQPIRQAFEPAWESQLVAEKPLTATQPPRAFSSAATEASEEGEALEVSFTDFEGLDWKRVKGFAAPLSTPSQRPSWVWRYGWRIWKEHTVPEQLYFLCKYCHTHKLPGGMVQVGAATSSAISHLKLNRHGHRLSKNGPIPPRQDGQRSIRDAVTGGLKLSQHAYQELSNFDVQGFREAAVLWLVDNNRPLREFETESFRKMISFANPEAEAALWRSHNSVTAFVMKLYKALLPQVKRALSKASSKVHISFDGWTTRGGKRGFFAIVAHFADFEGKLFDLPIALPQLVGAHTGEAIADCVARILRYFGINSNQLGCFMLDNAYNNDTAVNKLATMYGFVANDRRLRCACHILNLVGQTVMFGTDADAYDNAPEHIKEEDFYMKEWRRDGPLGVLLDIVNYINTPKQWSIFAECQATAAGELPPGEGSLREPFKPVVTRWNSFYDCFVRGLELQQPINNYIAFHIKATTDADDRAEIRGTKKPDAPRWMRSGGLTAADWAVISEYTEVLQPLKEATDRLQGRGRAGTHGALYEVLPVFDNLITELDSRLQSWAGVNYEPTEAPEDHLPINLRAARRKAAYYFNKLLQTPVYYTATALHPRYKVYFKRVWRNKTPQLSLLQAQFQQVWAEYKPNCVAATTLTPSPKSKLSSFDDAIDSILDHDDSDDAAIEEGDEYTRWLLEPMWTAKQHKEGPTALQYWQQLAPKYPNLSRLALDVLTIPASSAECERVFSCTGDITEPQRRKMGSQLLAALVCVQRWTQAGFTTQRAAVVAEDNDDKLIDEFAINRWEEPTTP